MTSATDTLQQQLHRSLADTVIPGLGPPTQRGCEDRYDLGEFELLIVTDRACAGGRVLPTVPFKGEAAVRIGTWWLDSLGDLLTSPVEQIVDPQAMLVRATRRLPVRIAVYGYLTGRLWKEYRGGERALGGQTLADNLERGARLDSRVALLLAVGEQEWAAAIQTADQLRANGDVDDELLERAVDVARRLYERGTSLAAERGVVLGSATYDLGTLADGTLVARDLLHAPHQASYWLDNNGECTPLCEREVLADWIDAGMEGELSEAQRIAIARGYLDLGERFVADFAPFEGPVANRLTISLSRVGLVG